MSPTPRQVCSFASQARWLNPLAEADFDCPELPAKAAETVSEAVVAADV